MNKVFTYYYNSSRFFLTEIEDVKVRFFTDYVQCLSKSELHNYFFLKDLIVTEFISAQGKFRFSELPNSDIGFLGKLDADSDAYIDPLHLALYRVFGTIIDSYSVTKSRNILPYSAVFTIDKDTPELGATQLDYLDKCKDNNIDAIPDLLTLTTLAVESNGNLVQYDKNGKLYFYLSDHILDDPDFVQVNLTPPDTFYFSKKFEFMKDWVDNYFYSQSYS